VVVAHYQPSQHLRWFPGAARLDWYVGDLAQALRPWRGLLMVLHAYHIRYLHAR
jgi:hypothetical protein